SAHENPEVRLRALVQLAGAGDARARDRATELVSELGMSADAADRRAAAAALASRDVITAAPSLLVQLLDDPDPSVRAAALDAVAPADAGDHEVVRRVVAALEDTGTTGSASTALRRVGDAAAPLLAAALAREGGAKRLPLVRAAAAAAAEH